MCSYVIIIISITGLGAMQSREFSGPLTMGNQWKSEQTMRGSVLQKRAVRAYIKLGKVLRTAQLTDFLVPKDGLEPSRS